VPRKVRAWIDFLKAYLVRFPGGASEH